MQNTTVSETPEKKLNYRQEAEIIRAKARETRDAEVRAQLLLIATLYDKLADHLLVARHSGPATHASAKDPTE